ncbi:MAG: hypothetical protein HQ481_05655 [Alphaproteobacteria bacterium]|nr:hypothetical protein [Alphaproteobacteria bacterium]
MSDEKNQGPLQTLRDGAVFAKLWQQEGKNGPFVSVTPGRTYRDEQSGEYRESQSFSGADILKVHALMLEAHQEAGKWREHFKQQKQNRQAELPMQPEQVQPQQQGLAAQRDAALAHAKAPEPAASPDQDRMPEH